MPSVSPSEAGSVEKAPSPRGKFSWRAAWPWMVAALPWALLINYLRLEWAANAQYAYGFVVPLLSLYLAAQLWPSRPEPRPPTATGGMTVAMIFLAALILPLLLFVEASPEWRLLGWVLAAVTTGLTAGLLWWRCGGPWVWHFIFPLLFIFAAVPWPTSMEYKVTLPLMQWDASTAVEILNWCGIPAIQHQNVIQLPNGLVGVDEACSGIRSFQTTLMIALFAGEWMRLRWGRRFVLLGAALVLTYVFNLMRTLALVTLSANWGNATLTQWHDTVGLSVLAFSLAGLWLLAMMIREKETPPVTAAQRVTAPAPWPRALLAGLGLWLAAAYAGTQGWFDWHAAHRAAPIRWSVAWPKDLPTYEDVQIPVEARTSLMYSAEKSSSARWQDLSTPTVWLGYFLRWDPGQETSILASTHHPDVCLPATGKPLVADYGVSDFSAAGLTFPVHAYQFKDGMEPLFIFFCLWVDGHAASDSGASEPPAWLVNLCRFVLPFTPPNELDYRLQAIAEGRRNEGQQVLELAVWGAGSEEEARKQFGEELDQLVVRSP